MANYISAMDIVKFPTQSCKHFILALNTLITHVRVVLLKFQICFESSLKNSESNRLRKAMLNKYT